MRPLTGRRHPKVIEDEKAVGVVLRLEEQAPVQSRHGSVARRMTVTAIGTRISTEPGRLPSVAAVEIADGTWSRGVRDVLMVPGDQDQSGTLVGSDRLNQTEATDFATF